MESINLEKLQALAISSKESENVTESTESEEATTSSAFESGQQQQKKADQWLNKTLWIELVDGRVIVGRFVCTDKHVNIILIRAAEFWDSDRQELLREHNELVASRGQNPSTRKFPDGKLPMRAVGMVLVKREHIKRIQLEAPKLFEFFMT